MTDFSGNGLLAILTDADNAALTPHIELVELEHSAELHQQGSVIANAYFPVKGLISLLASMEDGRASECAVIGQYGGVGLGAAMGRQRATSRAIVQIPGAAFRIPVSSLHDVAARSHSLTTQLFVYQEMLLAQVQQTAACNSLHTAEQRLARWLLQAQDYGESDDVIPFTQEFLSNMLGLRRSTVTKVATALQTAALIEYNRGRILVVDRRGLERAACECYRVISRLVAQPPPTVERKPVPRPSGVLVTIDPAL